MTQEVKEKKTFVFKKPAVTHRHCLNCGKFIDDRHSRAKYCSVECCQAHSNSKVSVTGIAQLRYENFLLN